MTAIIPKLTPDQEAFFDGIETIAEEDRRRETKMNEARHAPGPWTADHGDGGPHDYFGVFDANGNAICYLAEPAPHPYKGMTPLPAGNSPGDGLDEERGAIHQANAHLLAAAHDLLAAIMNSDDAHWTPAMRAAMRKALGEERPI